MKNDDRDRFLEVVIGFAELKGRAMSAAALELYWRAMKHWPLDAFREAATQLVRTCEFMPMPKDFEDLRRAGRQTPGEAWARVLSHCASGSWRSGGTGDPDIDAVAQMLGGYRTVAMTPTDRLGFIERRFCDHFEDLRDVNRTRQALPQVTHRSGKTQRLSNVLENDPLAG